MNAAQALSVFVKDVLKNLTLPMDFDRQYGKQCVDLVRFWWSFLALSQISTSPSSGAKDLWRNAPISQKVTNARDARPGDVFVMPATATNQWGHTGIVTSTVKANGKVDTIEANWDGKAKNPPLRQDKNVAGFLGLIRPPQFSVPDNSQHNQASATSYVMWRAKSLANVRAKATSASPVTGSRLLIPGDTFKGLPNFVIGADPYNDGRNKWVQSAKGNFVWAPNLERA